MKAQCLLDRPISEEILKWEMQIAMSLFIYLLKKKKGILHTYLTLLINKAVFFKIFIA